MDMQDHDADQFAFANVDRILSPALRQKLDFVPLRRQKTRPQCSFCARARKRERDSDNIVQSLCTNGKITWHLSWHPKPK
jgi:hypothetical protein